MATLKRNISLPIHFNAGIAPAKKPISRLILAAILTVCALALLCGASRHPHSAGPAVSGSNSVQVDGAIDATKLFSAPHYTPKRICLADGSSMCWDQVPDIRIQ